MSDGHIAVLGDGSMGTALAHVAAVAGRSSRLWCRSPAGADAINQTHRNEPMFGARTLAPTLRATADLAAAVRGADLVIAAVHSTKFRELAKQLRPLVTADQILLSSTKGIDVGSLKRMSQILAEEAGAAVVGTIGGANITPEIIDGKLTAIVVATTSREATAKVAQLLETPNFIVYANDDLVGVEAIGALKNVAAVALGIGAGLDFAMNARSFLLTRAVAEIRHLVVRLGGSAETFMGQAGLADLFLTCTSPQSLNRQLGIDLGRGKSLAEIVAGLKEVPEGITTIRACRALARSCGVVLPIAEVTASILEGELPATALEQATVSGSAYDVDRDPRN